MNFRAILMVSVAGGIFAAPALAQDSGQDGADENAPRPGEILVTAQRQAQSLQAVPIAVSAFDSAALESQQIENSSDLQLTLPNVSFSKTNFTSSSFTIRGIGDLCVGITCDNATAIHMNSGPLFSTRLFEAEYFDLDRVEILRGPQGTLFGRNATAGVVNVITAKPELGHFGVKGEFDYGNYDSIKAKGSLNVPIGENIAARVAGYYLNRDGYTTNLYDNSKVDGRDMYAVRGSLRFEPTDDTAVDLMAYYFREKDNRMRIQKQLCQRDPTGVLGCLNSRLDYGKTNFNSTFVGVLGSAQLFGVNGLPTSLGLTNLYGADLLANFQEPADPRKIRSQYAPTYYADELQLQAHLEHDFGPMSVSFTTTYVDTKVDSREDYWLGIGNKAAILPALNTLAVYAQAPGVGTYLSPVASALMPNGPNGNLCASDARYDNLGVYEGYAVCTPDGTQFDRSLQANNSIAHELIVSSDFDGKFNFLVGGIYGRYHMTGNSYNVNAFYIDYVAGLLGGFTALSRGLAPSYLATSNFHNNTADYKLKSYGIFGEAYYEINDRLKITAGLRYNDDKKRNKARSTLLSFLNPHSNNGDPFNSPYVGTFDADPGLAGNQLYQIREAAFNATTGRFVIDYQVTPDNLVYASYSRGYKSGGINPPLQPIFQVPETFGTEKIDAFEIGTKNTLADGMLQLNATAFYYKYKRLQLSRIIARTSVNDTIDANIWGLEFESLIRPSDGWLFNINLSYLNAKVAGDQYFSDPRDPGGGNPNAVIIKDITNGALCAVTGPSQAVTAGFVTAVNANIGLRAPTAFPSDGGIASTGAFGICSLLTANAPAGISVLSPGVEVNLKGNRIPQAPEFKASLGAQYTHEFTNGMTVVPRVDVAMTGEQYGNVFNGNVNRIAPFTQANAQIQINGADKKWFAKAYVQNIFDSSSRTGLYVTDASSGNFTNIFTLDPRRYGVSVGFEF